MAILRCRHCGSAIDSDARRASCRGCRELFPFQCAICARNLRSPFPIYDDERHLTLSAEPLPLCDDHFLRKCPDCGQWFQNDENPGYFRCASCAEKTLKARLQPEWSDELPESEPVEPNYPDSETARGLPVVAHPHMGLNPNTLVLGAAGCAFAALMGYFLLAR